ncbi:MAG: 8-oxo-dGDP phosphatase [Actinomycetota bacterium]|nr:8-oxo-dGDP phosphatase [Actinomycetota bacterium]
MSETLRDTFAPRPVLGSHLIHSGVVWDLLEDTVDLGEAGTVRREYVRHPGAVAVLALDDQDRVLLVRQYRHPVGMELWELPAGLMDVHGEPPWTAAPRELAEEADVRAERWDVLVDWFGSPGGMDEALRLYLARGISAVPPDERHTREAEEFAMVSRWVPLEQARDAVLAGRLHNPTAVIGVLAACAARDLGWSTLRPADAPWPEHPAHHHEPLHDS